MLPYRLISVLSLGGAYLLSSGRLPQWPAPGFLAAFTTLWGAQALVWFVWAVILYPNLFSPLRGLPGPSGGSLFMGQFKKISSLPTGMPMMDWYVLPWTPLTLDPTASQVTDHPQDQLHPKRRHHPLPRPL